MPARGERIAGQIDHGGPVARFLRLDQVERQRGPELPAVDDVARQAERRGLEPAEHDGDHARAVRRRADRDQHPSLLLHDHPVGLVEPQRVEPLLHPWQDPEVIVVSIEEGGRGERGGPSSWGRVHLRLPTLQQLVGKAAPDFGRVVDYALTVQAAPQERASAQRGQRDGVFLDEAVDQGVGSPPRLLVPLRRIRVVHRRRWKPTGDFEARGGRKRRRADQDEGNHAGQPDADPQADQGRERQALKVTPGVRTHGMVRVHGPRVTVVQQRNGAAAWAPIQPPEGQRQTRRALRCRRTEAR